MTDAAAHSFSPTRVLPSGFVDIAFYYLEPFLEVGDGRYQHLAPVVVTGPQTTFRIYAATGRTGIVIARFWPGAASAFLPQPLHELRDLNIDLADLIAPKCVQDVSQRLQEAQGAAERVAEVEAFLKKRMRPDGASLDVREAIDLIVAGGGRRSVSDLARAMHLSSRQLQRRFRQRVGIGPKALARIVRLQRALEIRASGWSWGMTAHAAGFQDQAHLANECRALSGLSPVEVHRRRSSTALAHFFNAGPGVAPYCPTLYV